MGRQRELDDLKKILEDARSGQGQLVMLMGEPGIGKTRTAQELSAYATQRGVQVLWGRCYEEPGMPPYWPWVQVIRSYVRGQDSGALRSEMGAGAAGIAEVVPEVRECLPDLPPPPALEPQQARFRFFDSITTFLMRISQTRPLMLVLDNIHWADRSSLLLLEFAAQELAGCQLLVVGTYRDAEPIGRHPLNHSLGELARHPYFSRLLLRGLNEGDIARFVQANVGFTPPQNLIGAVYAQTEGNPLFLTQVVQLLAQEGELTPEGAGDGGEWNFQMPTGVREVIRRRLERLSEKCNQVLIVASVIGREFGLDLLERLMAGPATAFSSSLGRSLAHALSSDKVLEAVEEGLAAQVIEELPQAGNRYQFTHVLIQDTLAQQLSSVRRARMRRRIAETLEEMYGSKAEAHATELAYHFTRAVSATDTEKLVHYSLLAGEQVLVTYAYEEAITHFDRALAAKAGQPVEDETAALLYGLGRAQAALADWPEATANLGLAFDYYTNVGDIARAASIAELPHLFNYIGQELATGIIRRALELAPPDSPETSRLLSRYCRALGQQEGNYPAATRAYERALTIARRQEDAALEMQVLTNGASVDGFHLKWEQCLEKCRQAIELSHRVDDPYIKQDAHGWAVRALHATGELEKGRTHSRAILSLAESLRDRYLLGTGLWLNEVGAHLAGEWRMAQAFSNRSLALLPDDPRFLSTRALLEYQRGDFDQGEEYLERLLQNLTRLARDKVGQFLYSAIVTPAVISLITDSDNYLDETEATARTLLSTSTTVPLVKMWASATLALIAVRRGDSETARLEYDPLSSRQSTMMVAGTIGISADRLLGLISASISQTEQAMAHFDNALVFCRRAGYQPEYAWSAYDYACTLNRRSTPGDRDKIMSLLNEALDISTRLGMRPLSERIVALRTEIESRNRRASSYPDGLTQREMEVLRLIALGKTNQEIADELVISLNTVVHHVTSILAKTGTANRTEAATYAYLNHLTQK